MRSHTLEQRSRIKGKATISLVITKISDPHLFPRPRYAGGRMKEREVSNRVGTIGA
jgi:hypothetical protein